MVGWLGKAHFWATSIPLFSVCFGQHFRGPQGIPRRYYTFSTYEYLQDTQIQNIVISVMAIVLVAGQVIYLVNFLWSLVKGRIAPANPWNATTLEWSVASPPPHGNFVAHGPAVQRWAYEYSPEGVVTDYVLQTSA